MNAIETGNPELGIDGYRRTLGEFATGVTVITTCVDGTRYGMTSNSFASVSLRPSLVLWSIRRESQSFAAFEACSHFAVNVLAHDQMALSQRFAKSGPNKFDGVASRHGIEGSPLLDGSAASFECRRTQTFDGGDHLILLGQVERFSRFDRQPLLFSKGRYAIAADHPDVQLPAGTGGVAPLLDDERLLTSLLVRAYGTIASQLEKGRKTAGLGLSLMQARLLKAAQTHPCRTLEELQPELLLDFNASQNVLDSVVAQGLACADDRRRVKLTAAGDEHIRSIVAHTRRNEEILFRGVSHEDLATVQRVLNHVIERRPR